MVPKPMATMTMTTPAMASGLPPLLDDAALGLAAPDPLDAFCSATTAADTPVLFLHMSLPSVVAVEVRTMSAHWCKG